MQAAWLAHENIGGRVGRYWLELVAGPAEIAGWWVIVEARNRPEWHAPFSLRRFEELEKAVSWIDTACGLSKEPGLWWRSRLCDAAGAAVMR